MGRKVARLQGTSDLSPAAEASEYRPTVLPQRALSQVICHRGTSLARGYNLPIDKRPKRGPTLLFRGVALLCDRGHADLPDGQR